MRDRSAWSTLQARADGNALIGRQLYPLLREAGFDDVAVSPRMVYVDGSRPRLVDGFTRKTFTAMIEGVREPAIAAGLMTAERLRPGHRRPLPHGRGRRRLLLHVLQGLRGQARLTDVRPPARRLQSQRSQPRLVIVDMRRDDDFVGARAGYELVHLRVHRAGTADKGHARALQGVAPARSDRASTPVTAVAAGWGARPAAPPRFRVPTTRGAVPRRRSRRR